VFAASSIHLLWTLGTLGSSLPMAIGAKVAFMDRQVVALCGDGAVMFVLPELSTALRARANLVIVVCDDGCCVAVSVHYRRRVGASNLQFRGGGRASWFNRRRIVDRRHRARSTDSGRAVSLPSDHHSQPRLRPHRRRDGAWHPRGKHVLLPR